MPATKAIEQAKTEIKAVLRRYRVNWSQVAPDQDELVWAELKPAAKKIRRDIFKKMYPSLKLK